MLYRPPRISLATRLHLMAQASVARRQSRLIALAMLSQQSGFTQDLAHQSFGLFRR